MTGRSCACGEREIPDDAADIRVLVVDDHAMVRTTLSEPLAEEDGLTVVGECEDGSQVVEAASRLRPDVVVLTGDAAAAKARVVAAEAHALVPKGVRTGALPTCLRTVRSGCGCCPYCL